MTRNERLEAHEVAAGSRGPDRHLNIVLFGDVTGVGLRQAVLHKALDLKLKGFVKNNEDKTVYIEAEGPKEALEELVNFCRLSPAWSSVSKFEVKETEVKDLGTFSMI